MIYQIMPTNNDKIIQQKNHNRNIADYANILSYYKHDALTAFNLSAGILITVIMIFRLKNSNV